MWFGHHDTTWWPAVRWTKMPCPCWPSLGERRTASHCLRRTGWAGYRLHWMGLCVSGTMNWTAFFSDVIVISRFLCTYLYSVVFAHSSELWFLSIGIQWTLGLHRSSGTSESKHFVNRFLVAILTHGPMVPFRFVNPFSAKHRSTLCWWNSPEIGWRLVYWFIPSSIHSISIYGKYTLWLWLTVRHGFSMALIEIDGLPFFKMVDLSTAMLVITRGYQFPSPW